MATDMFFHMEGITGEVQDEKYMGWIDSLSFSFGMYRCQKTLDAPELCQYNDFSVVKYFDSASPKLYEACDQGRIFPEAILIISQKKGDKEKIGEFRLGNVKIIACRPGGSAQSGEERPLEEISLAYEKIEWIYYLPKDRRTAELDHIKASSTTVNMGIRLASR